MALFTTTEMFKKPTTAAMPSARSTSTIWRSSRASPRPPGSGGSPDSPGVQGARAYANHTYLVKLVEAAVIECPNIPSPCIWTTALF